MNVHYSKLLMGNIPVSSSLSELNTNCLARLVDQALAVSWPIDLLTLRRSPKRLLLSYQTSLSFETFYQIG